MKSVIHIRKRVGWDKAYIDLDTKKSQSGVKGDGIKYSQFNAELCEEIIKQWSNEGDIIVDPFAGWGTRAVVTETLGRRYEGYEISPNTYNRITQHTLGLGLRPNIILGDGVSMIDTPNDYADMILTCPPYHTLEYYEITPNQLTDIPKYKNFILKIEECIRNCWRVLKEDGYACWVVGDFRSEAKWKGFINYHGDIIEGFKKAGFKHWDTIILHNPSPLTPIVESNAIKWKYSAKVHEYLLVFKKVS